MTGGGPRRQRARIWADLYAALFGAEEDDAGNEESETATEAARKR